MRVQLGQNLYDLRFVNPKRIQEMEGMEGDDKILGICEEPSGDLDHVPQILISNQIKGFEQLEVILHEAIHAGAWLERSEEWVDLEAKGLARMLWKLGYRKQ